MREMPFDDASFDGVVSVAAIDHLNREGVERTLAEVTRVLRPEGQFLLMVVNPDIWTKIAMPFLHGHGYFGGRAYPERWRSQLSAAGLECRGGRDTASVALFSDSEGESGPLRKREDVHRASFGHLRVLTGEEAIESVVHAARIAAPAAVHGEVLLAVDREG